MLLDQTDIEELLEKKCCCFGAAVAIGGPTLAGTVGGATIFATTGAAVAANMSLLGTVISGVGMLQSGKSEASQMAFQAAVAQNNATVARQQRDRALKTAELDAKDFTRQQGDLMATRRSLMGDTGAQATTGSPLAVSSDFAGESAYNAAKIRNQGFVTANRLEQDIRNQQGQASLYGMQGRQAVKSSYYKAGGSLFKTGGKIWGTVPDKQVTP
jgi:hypothetical protein